MAANVNIFLVISIDL